MTDFFPKKSFFAPWRRVFVHCLFLTSVSVGLLILSIPNGVQATPPNEPPPKKVTSIKEAPAAQKAPRPKEAASTQKVPSPKVAPSQRVSETQGFTPQTSKKTKPSETSTKKSKLRYPISVGISFWPIWMVVDNIPPLLEVNFGIRHKWLEIDLVLGSVTKAFLDTSGTLFGVGAMVSFYSVRRSWFRLRHGISFGLITDFEFKRNQHPDMDPYPFFLVRAHPVALQFNPFGDLWIELEPATTGFPNIYEVCLKIRYEL